MRISDWSSDVCSSDLVAGLRADADYMIWWHATDVEDLQRAYADFRRTTALGRASNAVWSNVALHRPAEFHKSHLLIGRASCRERVCQKVKITVIALSLNKKIIKPIHNPIIPQS